MRRGRQRRATREVGRAAGAVRATGATSPASNLGLCLPFVKMVLKIRLHRADKDDMEPMSTSDRMSLPSPASPLVAPEVPSAPAADPVASAERPRVDPVSMVWWRILTAAGLTASASLVAWQLVRVFDGQERLSALSWGALAGAVLGVVALLTWTWSVVENARRLLAPATTLAPPSPMRTVLEWTPALVVATAAAFAVAYMQQRLVLPENDTSTAMPLAVAAGSLVAVLVLSIRPLNAISATLRRLGGAALPGARLVWVPAVLIVTVAGSLFAMRAGNLFGEDFDGIAPAWAVAVTLIVPIAVGLVSMWRGALAAEETIHLGFDRRNGVVNAGVRDRRSLMSRLLRAEALPRITARDSKRIRLVPGAEILRLAMFIGLFALSLVAVVGALVMVLFWQEGRDGLLLPAQEERAWDALSNLQSLQRWLALGTLGVTCVWTLVTVFNARLASGRRRNPLLAALAWPAAAWGIWRIGAAIADAEQLVVVLGFVGQAIVFAVPFFLLERAAVAVQAYRSPLRLSYALGVVLLVLNQGLFGLATLERSSELADFGPLAGSLAVAALLQLIATLSVYDSSRQISDASEDLADDHNAMVDRQSKHVVHEQRRQFVTAFEATTTGSPSQVLAAPSDLRPGESPSADPH